MQATGTTTHVTASGNEAALRARSACVVQELAAIEGELYRAQTATRQNPSASSSASARRVAILKERHLVLEREQVYLERILAPGCEVEEYDQADSSTDVDLKRPASSRPFTVKQQREMAQSVDVAIAAMEAAPFKHLNFEYDEASVPLKPRLTPHARYRIMGCFGWCESGCRLVCVSGQRGTSGVSGEPKTCLDESDWWETRPVVRASRYIYISSK